MDYDRAAQMVVTLAAAGMLMSLEMGWPLWIGAMALGVPAFVIVAICGTAEEGKVDE